MPGIFRSADGGKQFPVSRKLLKTRKKLAANSQFSDGCASNPFRVPYFSTVFWHMLCSALG